MPDILYTERLLARPITEQDYEYIGSIFSDEEIMKYAWIDCISDKTEMEVHIRSLLDDMKKDLPVQFPFLLFDRTGTDFIGYANYELHYYHGKPWCAEIGYFLTKDHWGKGYALEIVSKLIDTCFTRHKVAKVNGCCNSENTGSEKVMIKAGMKKEGILRKGRIKQMQFFDELHYGITSEEWAERTARCI